AQQRVDERRLDGVVGILAPPEMLEAQPEDGLAVTFVQTCGVRLGRTDVGLRLDRSDRAHGTPMIAVVVETSGSGGRVGAGGTTTVGTAGGGRGSSSGGAGSCAVIVVGAG